MKQFLTVLKFELNNYFKNKGFVITTLILTLLMAAIVIVPTMIPGFLDDDSNEKEEVVVTENLGIFVADSATDVNVEVVCASYPAEWKIFETEDALKEAVTLKEVEAGFIMQSATEVTYVVDNLSMGDYRSDTFRAALAEGYKYQYLIESGLTAEQIAEASGFNIQIEEEILGKNSVQNYGYTYILVFVVYFLIIFYGQMIATSVTTEKSNRAIEILVTSVSSNSLICGKVLAGAIAGVIQATLILGSAFAAYHVVGEKWGGILDFLFNIPTNVLLIYAIFALLSYVLYAFIFGMLGALVSKTEDISKSSTPVMMIYIASFLIAMLGMTNSDSMLMKVTSFIPFTSGNAMFVRASMGHVAGWEIALSAGILAISSVIAGMLAAKIFRFGTLHYGNPIKLKTALKKAAQ